MNWNMLTEISNILTAIATAILAGTAFVTYRYAKQQLDLMTDHNKTLRKYNGAWYIEKILELSDSVSDSYLEVSKIRNKIVKIKSLNQLTISTIKQIYQRVFFTLD